MVAFNLNSLLTSLLVVGLVNATPTLLPRVVDCTGVGPSPGGPPCGSGQTLTCVDESNWKCPNGAFGVVPPGTSCLCNAFRAYGWIPNQGTPTCTSGIECSGPFYFRVCGTSGEEPIQPVAPGTVCKNNAITFA